MLRAAVGRRADQLGFLVLQDLALLICTYVVLRTGTPVPVLEYDIRRCALLLVQVRSILKHTALEVSIHSKTYS